MTVLRPSLPPESWTTTRTLSSESSVRFAASAKANCETKEGTVEPSETTARPPRPTLRNWRRDGFMGSFILLTRRGLHHGEEKKIEPQMDTDEHRLKREKKDGGLATRLLF